MMANDETKSSTKLIIIILSIAAVLLVIWKFPALRSYAYGLLSSEAIVPMPEYLVSDAPKIIEIAKTNRTLFDQQYFRQTLSGDVVFSGSETRGNSSYLIRMTTPGAAPITLSCSMNKFAFAAHKDTLGVFKSGDIVHVKGPIGSDTDGQAISLGDGCVVEKSYSHASTP